MNKMSEIFGGDKIMENNKTAGKPRFKVKGDTVLITLICIFLASAPFYMSAFRTNMLGKYMCFALS